MQHEPKQKHQKLGDMPKKFSSVERGTFTAAGAHARRDALERIKLNAPAFTEDRELRWESADKFAHEVPVNFEKNVYGWDVQFAQQIGVLDRCCARRFTFWS